MEYLLLLAAKVGALEQFVAELVGQIYGQAAKDDATQAFKDVESEIQAHIEGERVKAARERELLVEAIAAAKKGADDAGEPSEQDGQSG